MSSRTRAINGVATGALIGVLGASIIGVSPASAAVDASAPVLHRLTVSDASPTSGSRILETVAASDVGTGVGFIVVSIRDEVGKTHTVQATTPGDLQLSLDSTWALGPAHVTDIVIYDNADNFAVYDRDGSATVLEDGRFSFLRHDVDLAAGDFSIAARPAAVPFERVSAPSLSVDDARVGDIVTALPGTWSPAPSSTTVQWYADGEPLIGETSRALRIGPALVGRTVTVAQTGRREGYETQTLFSRSSVQVRPSVPLEYSVAPSVSGSARVGETVTADVGQWPVGSALQIRWLADGVPIVGESADRLTLTSAELGKRIRVVITGSAAGYSDTTVESVATAPVSPALSAFATARPTVSGEARQGSTLTVSAGAWTPTPTAWKYRWMADGKAIAGATKPTLTVPGSLVGTKISVEVTGLREGYAPATVRSVPSNSIVALKKLTAAPKPKITGTAKVGKTLTVAPGKWTPAPVKLTYQWYVNGTPVTGATKSTFKIPKSAVGKTVTVIVTGSKAGYAPAKQASQKTVKVKK